ncbi:MAG TPA: hypothetical protein DGG94_08240 [Micromonosporaceae bacterium]|nr:hypothetical protein [Micromonosporaceae bacterium]HCU49774.1 hypothetical protein [Micromonosporaceae bacterium]
MRALSLLLVTSLLAVPSTVDNPGRGSLHTLVTGDRVRVGGPDRLVIKPAPGREKVRFLAHRLGDGLQVIPVDQLPQIHAGKVSRRQFEVVPATTKPVAARQIHALTLTHLGRDGEPAQIYDTLVINRDSYETTFLHGPPETGTLYLPAGRYVAYTVLFSGNYPERPEMTMLAIPSITLDGDQSFSFDGRASNHMSVSVPHPTAKQLLAEAGWEIRVDPQIGLGGSMLSDTYDGFYIGHAGPDADNPEFVAKATSQWAEMGPDGTAVNSPVAFMLSWYQEGRLFTGLKKDVKPTDLARIRAKHHSHLANGLGLRALWSEVPGKAQWGIAAELYFYLPFSRVEYVNNDSGRVRWHIEATDDAAVSFLRSPGNYQPGRTYSQTWNNAVFGPGTDGTRNGDAISVYVPIYTDASGHPGYGVAHTSRTALFRNSTKVFEAPDFNPQTIDVPPDDAQYRLEVAAQRGDPWPYDLSSDVKVAWTFRSRHTDSAKLLPLSVVRFTPALRENNTAPAGCSFTLPISVQRQAGGSIRKPTVFVSYNDGLTWQQVSLRDAGSGWATTLHHPMGNGWVSLRAKHTDSSGNIVEQTIIHAYRISS